MYTPQVDSSETLSVTAIILFRFEENLGTEV
jgi:hypothetical protein